MMLELPWALDWHGAALVPVNQSWRGLVIATLDGLQCGYQ